MKQKHNKIEKKKEQKVKESRREKKLVAWFYNTSFMRSLDLDRNYFYVLGLDILFVILLLLTVGLFKNSLNFYALQANEIMPEAIKVFQFMNDPRIKSTPEVIGEVYEGVFLLGYALNKFLWKTILTLSVLITFVIFLVALIKGYAWTKIKKETFTKNYLRKFFIANFVWYWAAILLFFWALIFLRRPVDMIAAHAIIILFFYLVTVMNAVFNENYSLWKNTKNVFYYGIVKLYKFLPVLLFFIFFFIIIILFSGVLFSLLLYFNIRISLDIVFIILILMFIMEIAWIKFYYYEVYMRCNNLKWR